MLVKTDYEELKKAKIILQCELRPSCYEYFNHKEAIDLRAISQALKELEHDFVNPDGSTRMMLSTMMPVGCGDRMQIDWLVVEIVEAGKRHETPEDWEKFLAQTTAKIIKILSLGNDARIATVEYDNNKRFIVMNDIDPHDESDYIDY